MRRIVCALLAATLGVAASGCIAVSAKNNRFASDLDAVTVDGEIYVVNKRSGQVAKVDKTKLCCVRDLIDDDDDMNCD